MSALLPAPEHPGWHEWRVPGPFNREVIGTLLVRDELEARGLLELVVKSTGT